MLAALGHAVAHAAQAQARDFQAGLTKPNILHTERPLRVPNSRAPLPATQAEKLAANQNRLSGIYHYLHRAL
jgi:hypothetical protein